MQLLLSLVILRNSHWEWHSLGAIRWMPDSHPSTALTVSWTSHHPLASIWVHMQFTLCELQCFTICTFERTFAWGCSERTAPVTTSCDCRGISLDLAEFHWIFLNFSVRWNGSDAICCTLTESYRRLMLPKLKRLLNGSTHWNFQCFQFF